MTLPSEMTAIAITAPGGPEVLQPVRQPLPQPGPNEVLIRVAAAGINGPDVSQRRGRYDPPPGASPLPGLEVSGVVAAVGAEVAGFAEGQPVVALCNGGGYAEFVAVAASQVLPLPNGWLLVDGAALPETFFTVQQTLVMRAGLAPGMAVLIHGAAGGIGGTAIQIARLFGARPIAVVSTPEKARYAESLGADAVIEHQREDFVERTLQLTGGKGADRIVDMVGGDHLPRNIEAAARGGHIVLLASLSGAASTVNAGKLVFKWLTVSGSTLRPQPAAVKAEIADSLRRTVWPGLADGRIRPPRLQRLPLERASEAHSAMEDRAHFGKIVLLTKFGEEG